MRLLKNITIITLIIILIIITVLLLMGIHGIQDKIINYVPIDKHKELLNVRFSNIYILSSILAGVGLISLLIYIFFDFIQSIKLTSTQNKIQEININDSEEELKKKQKEQEELALKNFQLKSENLKKGLQEIYSKQVDLKGFADLCLKEFSQQFEIVQGQVFVVNSENQQKLKLITSFACYISEDTSEEYEIGEGLIGQVAKNKKILVVDNVPQGYITIASGLGQATPSNLLILPLLFESNLIGIIELASFIKFTKADEGLFNEISSQIGIAFFNKLKNN